LRILHLASSHRWTGAAEPATSLAKTQIELGHEAALACIRGDSFWRKLQKRKVPFVDGFHFLPGVRPVSIVQDIRHLRGVISEQKCEVVHCHLTHDHWVAALALRGMPEGRRPILVRTLHRDVLPPSDPVHRWLFATATDLIITVSRERRDELIALFDLPPEKVVWIRGAVSTKRFHPALDPRINRDLWRIPATAPVAGIVARMQPHRGHMDFIQSIDAVLAKIPDARYIVSGRGEVKQLVRKTIHDHPHRKHLIEAGYRKKDLAETYAAMDVSVLLARGSDGSCRAMLEAMACARPVIGVRQGAIAETIEHGKTGWLIDHPIQQDALAGALIEALGNLERTAEMGRAARTRIAADFTEINRAETTVSAYEVARARCIV
jgi:glycosyltransferase involved in cell wall biosynthesis